MQAITDSKKPVKRPVRVLQYGEGNFLRAFADWKIDILNEKTDFNGNVVIVQPLERGLGDMINAQKGLYTTVLRGVQSGKTVEEYRTINSVQECLNPYHEADYQAYMALASSKDLRFVFSNTTEAGIAYHEGDKLEDRPQVSFPAKLCAFLYKRYQAFSGDKTKGLIVIPCELIDKNGDNLKRIVEQYAHEWKLEAAFTTWLEEACDFCNSLVDRIVPGYPKAEAAQICEKLGYQDNLLVSAEIFHLWVIECHKDFHEDELPFAKAGLNVIWTDDMSFYRTRKVRILNGAHTLTVLAAYQAGLDTVQECIADKALVYPFMHGGIFDEIIPSMDGSKEMLEQYAKDVLERFENPYNPHQLLSISLNSVSKFKTRDLPSLLGYYEKHKNLPKRLVFSLAALISFYEGTEYEGSALKGTRDGQTYLIQDSPEILATFAQLYKTRDANQIAKAVLGQQSWWGQDLNQVTGLHKQIAENLQAIWSSGMKSALTAL
ncbi:tagaturonate reductase [Sphaerochaeta sp. PS]|uniref:tagaturonate reductase n=1 Tax=Sphaerochaeta sp. PS TaxID=3076336 RepID=UPI0028A2F25E|nr:tagaturonate reductase [Sphaerochaeta sp. PS]MDT4763031.1 tagaturonate reductase [Sphaerochaeta sp. PS]